MLKETNIFHDYQLLYQETKQALIWRIQKAKKRNSLTPEVIADYASLMLTDDDKLPILPAFHHNVWLQLFCNENIKKLLIISPPGSAKTTWLIQAYLGCRLGFYPDENYIIGSVTDEVAEIRSLALRNDIESELWKEIFPDVEINKATKWEQTKWSIKSENSTIMGRLHPTISAYGVGSSSIGGRANMLFGDDLLSRDNTFTQGQREKTSTWIENSFLTRLKPKGRTILIGTMWNASDYYSDIRRNPKGWVICHCSSYMENEFYINLYYPDNYKGEMLGVEA